MSGEQKFVRARYILVAAMINVTIAGVWNIYVAEGISNQLIRPLRKTRTYEIQGSYYFQPNRVQSTTVVDEVERKRTYDLDPTR